MRVGKQSAVLKFLYCYLNVLQCLANNEILIMSNAGHVRNTGNSLGQFEMVSKVLNEMKINEYKDMFKCDKGLREFSRPYHKLRSTTRSSFNGTVQRNAKLVRSC